MDIISEKIEIDFTDEKITASDGAIFLACVSRMFNLPQQLKEKIKLKKRNRGASDVEMLLSLIYSLAQGDGALSDVDRLKEDEARCKLLGLIRIPDSRRLGEYLSRFKDEDCQRLLSVAHNQVKQVVDYVIKQEIEEKGYVPVFVDSTAIEVYGQYFEKAGKLYNDFIGYLLHTSFIGGLWATQRLLPGGVHPAHQAIDILKETASLIPKEKPVWAFFDNAYYNWEVVDFCITHGWDYSISVTSETYKRPLKESVSDFTEADWEEISDDAVEHAAYIYYRPSGWKKEQVYVVVRTLQQGAQKLLFPRYSFILVSRDDLPLKEVVKRHRSKQGLENTFKGPLIALDLHHPPCSSFQANRAFYISGQISQILLVGAKLKLLPAEARKHGIRTVIRDLVRVAGKLVRHARKWKLLFSKSALRIEWLYHAAVAIESSG